MTVVRALSAWLVLTCSVVACRSTPDRARDPGGDERCPPERPRAYAFCGLPDPVQAHATADDCVPWPNRPPNLWMAYCCPETEETSGIGTCR